MVEKEQILNEFALLGILNSKVASFYHFNSSPKATKGAFPKILANDIKTFPLPDIEGNEKLVERISKRTSNLVRLAEKSSVTEEFRALNKENERDIYLLYRISDGDIEVIEKYFEESNT